MRTAAITVDPETMGGEPVFTGTRVPIQNMWDYLMTGETLDEFLENFPTVRREQALEVLVLADDLVKKAAAA
ncbi:DUF433 domain-containing protein [Hymenobacter weizhouensis]|uniref:DUF433 domain-containing protein n=1 Tax=Hymenobacter sp. YIM 151500-1 TaxID=2987689 RepID=UPI00222655AD|nr:DUF433 domain-containing protein [Hymenobacter sp. YIM 151500-1]UYZ62965.1 DUF433 domain-containing protein [Hymenobacter sp. YIM 151500-1]